MILKPAPVDMKQFDYDYPTQTFTAEMSSTNGFGQVYDDSADIGLTIVSHHTGMEVVFVVTDTHFNGEGELEYWTLKSLKSYLAQAEYTATVFND